MSVTPANRSPGLQGSAPLGNSASGTGNVPSPASSASPAKPTGHAAASGFDTAAAPKSDLKRGAQGADVKLLQNDLVKLGYLTKAEQQSGPGIFGAHTESAVKGFQRDHGLPPTGFYGPMTRAALNKALGQTHGQPGPHTGGTGGAGKPPGGSSSDAILGKLNTTGASRATASQDGDPPGVTGSRMMAHTDLGRVSRFKQDFQAVGKQYGLPPALLAGIASRETRGGNALDSRGFGSDGHGYGLMQVDNRFHTLRGGPYSRQNIEQGAQILKGYLGDMQRQHPSWSPAQQLRAAVASYNKGPNVSNVNNMDAGTTGGDYSADTWARAQYYAKNGF